MTDYFNINTKRFSLRDCAIVMQGPVANELGINRDFVANIRRIRCCFPDLKIIVSCWELPPDLKENLLKISRYYTFKVVFNIDPGSLSTKVRGANYICNVNRMIVSTRNALNLIDETYVIKIRADSYFSTDKIKYVMENYYNNISFILGRELEYKVFNQRIINANLFARDAEGYLPYLFHPGDILLAGLKKDLIKLFDINLARDEIFEVSRRGYFYTMMKLVPEQYLWINCIERETGNKPFDGNAYFSEELVNLSEKYYVNNFYLISSEDVDFKWSKHQTHYNNKGKFSVYSKDDWYKLYNKHILKHTFSLARQNKKFLITKLMIFYFIIRTTILRIPYLKMLAIKIFSKRG